MMKKRIFALLMAFVMLLGIMPVGAFAAETGPITGAYLDSGKVQALTLTQSPENLEFTLSWGLSKSLPLYQVTVPAGTEYIYVSYADGVTIQYFADYFKDTDLTDGQMHMPETTPMLKMPMADVLGTGKIALLYGADYDWIAAIEFKEGASCNHVWNDATCSAPKTCSLCGATDGGADPDAHKYVDGTCEHCGKAEPVTYPFTLTVGGEALAITDLGTTVTCNKMYYTAKQMSVTVPAGTTTVVINGVSGAVTVYPNHGTQKNASPGSNTEVSVSKGTYLCMRDIAGGGWYHIAIEFASCETHTWQDATCSTPKTCSVCGETEGEADPDAHKYVDGKCQYCQQVESESIVEVTGITLDQVAAELEVGGIVTLKATVAPDNATDKTVTWTSSNEAVATVADGVVTAVSAGEAIITAKAGDKEATCTVTVTEKTSVPFSQKISVPANGDATWGNINGLTLSGTDGSIYEAYWSSTSNPFVLDVILGQDTDPNATITAEFSRGGSIGDRYKPTISGTLTVTLVDGKGTITMHAEAYSNAVFYPHTDWTINLVVDDGSAANRTTHEVTLPTETEGYIVVAHNSESPVIEGRDFSFKVTIDGEYKKGEDFKVLANGEELTGSGDVYTITNITEAKTVTVEGVVPKTVADKNVVVIAPAGSTIASGRHYSYFKYDFSEPLEETTLEDGRIQKVFPTQSGRQGFVRVQHPDGVTYWNFDGLTAGSVFEITEEMLFIGSTEFTKETVYANFEKNVKDKADLYLTANEKGWLDLNTGDTWNLNVFRNFLSLGNTISNDCLALPDVEYKVITVDGVPSDGVITVTPNENNSSYAEIKAVGAGTAIILVSYDAVYNADGEGGQQWSAIWPENTGVIIVTVDAEDASITTNMTVNEEANAGGKQVIDAEHDILFYVGDSGASYSFKPEDGCTVTVNRSSVGSTMTFGSFTGSGVETADDGTVTVTGLTTGAHIVKVEKGGKAVYQVIRARQVSYEVKHSDGTLVTAENPAQPGESVTIQFHRLISPMEKLSGVYNTNFAFYYIGEDGTDASSTSSSGYGVYTFSGTPSLQKFNVNVPVYWNNTTYTLTDGALKIGGFGSNAGAHRTTTYIAGKEVNTNASGVAGILSVLPDVVIHSTPCGYNSYDVTLPTGDGYTVSGGEVPVPEGETYTFTVTVSGGYDSTNMVVKVNGKAINGENGIYAVENVAEDLTVTVEGVEKITADMSNAVAVYTNGVDGSEWGRGTSAYVDIFSIGGAKVESYAWDGDTCNVTLTSDTPKNAAVGFVWTVGGSNASWYDKMGATLNGTAMPVGEPMAIKLVDGTATVEIYAAFNNSSRYGGTKTFVLSIAEESTADIESVVLDKRALEMEVGGTETLTATVSPDNAIDKTVNWTSSNEAVATVADGVVTAVSEGTATITAKAGEKEATCTVTVKAEEVDNNGVKVYLSMSHDADFMVGEKSKLAMALREITIPWFDLSLYGMEEYAYEQGKPTVLHLYIYATEVYYCGVAPEAAGQGYLYEQGLMNDLLQYEGSAGSIYFLKFWGQDCNLNYYVNYQYPAKDGWGVTADQLVLANNDIISVGHFTDWSFYSDSASGFNYLDIGGENLSATVQKGEQISLTVYLSNGNLGGGTSAGSVREEALDIYYAKADTLTNGVVSQWNKLGTTDSTGKLEIAVNLEPGTYVLALPGQVGMENPLAIVSAPGSILLNVLGSDAGDQVQDVINLIDAIGEVTLDSEAAITAARNAYDALTEDQQAAVTNFDKLTDAEAKLAQLKQAKADRDAADAVTAKINAIGTVTLDSKAAIEEARTAYDALTDDQKALVSEETLKKLTDAEAAYAKLIADEADKAAAKAVEEKIAAIGTVTLDS